MLHHLLELLGLQQPESQSLPAPQPEPEPKPQPQPEPEAEPIAPPTLPTVPDPVKLPRNVQRLVEHIRAAFNQQNYANLENDYHHKLAGKLIKKLAEALPPLYLKLLREIPRSTHDEESYLQHITRSLNLNITAKELETILDTLEESGLLRICWKPELFNEERLCCRWELTLVGLAVVELARPDQCTPDIPLITWGLPPYSLNESVFNSNNPEPGILAVTSKLTQKPYPIEPLQPFDPNVPFPPKSTAPTYREMLPNKAQIKALVDQLQAVERTLEPITQTLNMQGVDLQNAWKYICIVDSLRTLQMAYWQLANSIEIPPIGDADHEPWATYQWRVLHEAQSLVRQQSPFTVIDDPFN